MRMAAAFEHNAHVIGLRGEDSDLSVGVKSAGPHRDQEPVLVEWLGKAVIDIESWRAGPANAFSTTLCDREEHAAVRPRARVDDLTVRQPCPTPEVRDVWRHRARGATA